MAYLSLLSLSLPLSLSLNLSLRVNRCQIPGVEEDVQVVVVDEQVQRNLLLVHDRIRLPSLLLSIPENNFLSKPGSKVLSGILGL